MQDADILNDTGNLTGKCIKKKPPYSQTTLKTEMSKIMLNGEQIFHMAVITMAGPDAGISRVVVPYNLRNPQNNIIQCYIMQTLKNLAAFFYHWWTKRGSTQLEQSKG